MVTGFVIGVCFNVPVPIMAILLLLSYIITTQAEELSEEKQSLALIGFLKMGRRQNDNFLGENDSRFAYCTATVKWFFACSLLLCVKSSPMFIINLPNVHNKSPNVCR